MTRITLTDTCRFLHRVTEKALNNKKITFSDAERIQSFQHQRDIFLLLAQANIIREHFHGSRIDLCAIINAKSGKCSENCKFCAQSTHHTSVVPEYPLLKKSAILKAAKMSRLNGVNRFSIVTSGKGIAGKKSFESLCNAIKDIAKIDGLSPCASLGILKRDQFRMLHASGMKRYHHNLETSKSFFPGICTTHSFDDRVKTIHMAQEEGLEVCCGGILGLGETPRQRIELACTLRELNVDSVPLNFLNPIPGTPFEKNPLLPPIEILKAIALFRFILPTKEIRICGGREINLRTLQPFIYSAGANGTMVGNYLTTTGRDVKTDLREISDMGLAYR